MKRRRGGASPSWFVLGVLLLVSTSFADEPWSEEGLASWYGPGFAGRPTASTEIYDPDLLTAAHKSLPLGSLVRVYNLDNGRNMIVRINDRGPFVEGRVIDLSRAAAEVLDCKEDGLARVRLVLLSDPNRPNALLRSVQQAKTIITPDSWEKEESDDDALTPGYYVQIGAFSDLDNAQSLLERTNALGMRAYVEKDGDTHRVVVGPYTSFSHASSAQRELERAGIEGFLRLTER
jgi:rare lipoprotein A